MRRAIRKHLGDFAAILGSIVIALVVAGYIMGHQRFYLPKSFPLVGTDFSTLNADFETAKSVTPGQGQTVTIAGVDVGEISRVDLVDGRARIQMKIRRKYAKRIRENATMLLRPKTGLEDMTIELSPGTRDAPPAPEGWTIPIQNTLPDVKFEEVLSSLDADTRDYLRLLVQGAGEGLKNSSGDLAKTFKRFEPGTRELRRITAALQDRRTNIKRSIHNLQLLVSAVGEKDDQLTQLIDSSNAVFRSFADQDANLRSTLQQLPPTLKQTNTTLARVNTLAQDLGPTLQQLRPTARALAPTLRQVRPFLQQSTPVIRDEIRPFARDAQPTVRSLRPAARDLAAVTPDLYSTFKVVNYLLNELAYNPKGPDEGYLFWASWASHIGANVFNTQDAHGPIRRGTILLSCSSARVLDTIIAADPRLGTITQLSGVPTSSEACPSSSQAGGTTGGNVPGTGQTSTTPTTTTPTGATK